MNKRNDDVAKKEQIGNALNVSIIFAIYYDEFEKICKKNNLQLFVFQYDNINNKITIVTIISKKNEIIKILFKYHDYADVFDKIDVNKLFEHKFHDYVIETKGKIFFFDFIYNLFIRKLETFRKYSNDNFKKEFIVFVSSFADECIMFVKKKRKITIVRKL